jgi:ribonucleoside-diphosphate reductase alpha chain
MQIYPWTEQRQAIFLDRYAMKGVQGEPIEHSMCQMWDRVAKAIAKTPHEAGLYVECLFHDNLFIPAGRVLSGAGTLATQPTFYNCYVLGFEPTSQHSGADSRDGIMTTIKRMVELTSRGGGVGINWSVLRPSGSYIRGVEGFSSGPCEWMAGADALANQVRQGGSRTAALMFMLNDWHPT